MISLKKSTIAMALAAVALAGFGQAGFCGGPEGVSGAKGLFLEQLDSPNKALNTGVQYWIELHRDGRELKVNNKYKFKSGDRIRFHVKSNIDGYAYILLKEGSRGEQSVLFPDDSGTDNNRVKRGSDYEIPAKGYLTFDENPGLEKVSPLLSRTPIDAQAYLDRPVEAPTLIASAMTGAKDLIPQRVLVHYNEDKPRKIASAPPPKRRVTPATVKPRSDKPSSSPKVESNKPTLEGVVTVVSELPSNVLHIDVDLHHI